MKVGYPYSSITVRGKFQVGTELWECFWYQLSIKLVSYILSDIKTTKENVCCEMLLCKNNNFALQSTNGSVFLGWKHCVVFQNDSFGVFFLFQERALWKETSSILEISCTFAILPCKQRLRPFPPLKNDNEMLTSKLRKF